jgi:hypothetical protein
MASFRAAAARNVSQAAAKPRKRPAAQHRRAI